MAEPLVLGLCRLEVELLLQSLKSINRQVVIKFRQIWFRQEAKYYCQRSTNSLILFRIRKNCLISGRSSLAYQFIKRVKELTVIIIVWYHFYQLHTKCYWISYIDEFIGDHQCGFRRNISITDQIFCICQILKKNGSTMRQYISYS
jgi:hypothetical protein